MECLFPVVQDEENAGVRTLFNRPCGYCEACRLTYRQTWAARIQLEAQCHAENIFVTLTYDQDHLPDPPQLVPDHLSAFVKRLRARFAPLQFRFFACGEYGSRTLRPHYHVVLFGLPCNAEVERQVLSAWGAGHVSISQLSPARASYVAKYVCKDISDDDKLPEGYQREFARMSRNPGIGAGFIVAAADAVNRANRKQRQHGFPDITDLVKGSMRIGPVYYPTGRYLRTKAAALIDQAERSKLSLARKREKESRDRGDPIVRANDKVRNQRLIASRRIGKSRGVL